MIKNIRILLAFGISALLLAATSCNKDDDNNNTDFGEILDKYFTIENAFPSNSPNYPSPSHDSINPPEITEISGEQVLPEGGKITINVSVSKPVNSVIVGVDTSNYYYALYKETAADVFSFDFVFNEEPEVKVYHLYFTAIENDTIYSQPKSLKIITINGVVDDLEVKCEWDNPVDIDLFLQEPSGEVVYFDNWTSENYGYLNRDSNPFCWLDSLNEESIIYDGNSAVEVGEYKVMTRFLTSCDISDSTTMIVSVLFNEKLLDLGSTPNPFTKKMGADEIGNEPFDLFNFEITSGLKSTVSQKMTRVVYPEQIEEKSLTPNKKKISF